ncbi:MAG: hypothetical protein GXP55_21160 [Deltaproteobacteria bacterium]|nr:hypothetical protein [Deltaproteobacteria bacterium]
MGKFSTKLPALQLHSTKYGARMLLNRAEKLMALETKADLRQEGWRITDKFEAHHLPQVLTHLVEHGALGPSAALAEYLLTKLRPGELSRERLLEFMRQTDEPTLQALPESVLRAVGWLYAKAPEEDMAALELGPQVADATQLFRGLELGQTLASEEAAGAMRALIAPLHRGRPAGRFTGAPGECASWTYQTLDHEQLAETLRALGGERWIDSLDPESAKGLPWEVLAPQLAGRPLRSVSWLLGASKDVPLLEQREEPASEFFALADEFAEDKPWAVEVLRFVGMSRAQTPEHIPPFEAQYDAGRFHLRKALGVHALSALGCTRLDAWALGQLESVDFLRDLWLRGATFGGEVLERLLSFDELTPSNVERWAVNATNERGAPAGLERCLPIVVEAATRAEGLRALALRRWVAAILANYPKDRPIPRECDGLLEPGRVPHLSYYRPTVRALAALPPERAEAILWSAAPDFAHAPEGSDTSKEVYRELRFFRHRLSNRYLEHIAEIILEYRDEDMMWSDINHTSTSFKREGVRLAEALASRLAGESVSESLLERVRSQLGDEAAERIVQVAGSRESVRDEIVRLAQALPGPKRCVYVLWPTQDPADDDSAAYTGGRPRGFAKEDLPKAGGRRLVHAFTLKLSAVPELQARFPEQASLSIFVQTYTEDATRAQALLPRSEAQLAAEAGDLTHARGVELQRLELPERVFDERDETEDKALDHLRGLIYRQAGHLLGGPLWLQDGPHGLDERFVCQFDERLADINLGDGGVAYAFDHECVWQCH